ncbi:cilia- and flagella-associated protein 206-like [Sitophilus oryzae]|uniref:Cilia- and flagella-associated protein 206 n=1 Tax=Sitophilus oryzae TaxID=7048 RepID=A0A6J2XR38_SITOR|nr:cilia- and flagella-associated protein 206-like [Sitophilus oryzae]
METEENAYVRNIVKEISRECAPRKIDVNKNFLTYLTKILLINPNWGIDNDFFNQRQNVQIFVRYVIDELLVNPHHPNMVTLKIQFYFSCNLDNMEFVVELDRYNLRKKLSTLKDDICSTGKMADKEEIDKLYRKNCVLHNSPFGTWKLYEYKGKQVLLVIEYMQISSASSGTFPKSKACLVAGPPVRERLLANGWGHPLKERKYLLAKKIIGSSINIAHKTEYQGCETQLGRTIIPSA